MLQQPNTLEVIRRMDSSKAGKVRRMSQPGEHEPPAPSKEVG